MVFAKRFNFFRRQRPDYQRLRTYLIKKGFTPVEAEKRLKSIKLINLVGTPYSIYGVSVFALILALTFYFGDFLLMLLSIIIYLISCIWFYRYNKLKISPFLSKNKQISPKYYSNLRRPYFPKFSKYTYIGFFMVFLALLIFVVSNTLYDISSSSVDAKINFLVRTLIFLLVFLGIILIAFFRRAEIPFNMFRKK